MNNFTFSYYQKIFQTALDNNYEIITLKEFFMENFSKNKKILVNRIDVDVEGTVALYGIPFATKMVGSIRGFLCQPILSGK